MRVLVLARCFPPDMGGASASASNAVKGCLVKVSKLEWAGFPRCVRGDGEAGGRIIQVLRENFA